MEPTDLHQTIAGQIDHMKPAGLRPGIDIGMEVIDALTLAVVVKVPERRRFDIHYDEGMDTYTVTPHDWAYEAWLAHEPIGNVYCTDLGGIVFGEEASEWTMPIGGLYVEDADGNMIEVERW
jgi:hypothetical protein